MKNMQPTLKLNIIHEDVCKTLIGFLPPSVTIVEASNGYQRSSLNGLTVTFFKQLLTGSYHTVVCEINEEELRKVGMKYDDLVRIKFNFIF